MATTQQQTKANGAAAKAAKAKADRERKALAQRIIKLRQQGIKWDGKGGICEQTGIKTALVGRALMREFGAGEAIKPLTGKRAKAE